MNTRAVTPRRTCLVAVAGAVALPMMATPAAATGTEVGGLGSTFYLTNDNAVDGERVDYGRREDRAFAGDWDGDGKDTIAVRRGNLFHLKNSISAGDADHVFAYGKAEDVVLVGDWDGDGVDTPAVRRGNQYHFTNNLEGGDAQQVIEFGRPDDEVLVGDWNGDGKDTIAVRRGNQFFLNDQLASGDAERVEVMGDGSGKAIAGSWDGGADSIGLRSENRAILRHADGTESQVSYGRASDAILVGDWDGNGTDTLGVRRDLYTPPPAPAVEPQSAPAAQSEASRSDAVLAAARAKIGNAYYRYGGNGPSGYDCSGFTSYAYGAAGISLPRTSSQQRDWAARNGTEVPLSQAQPGDLLWWPGHVAIYAGNGKIIDAANPSTGISERRLYGSPRAFRIL